MARKLERTARTDDGDEPAVGRRGYVKVGVLSTLFGGTLMSATPTAGAEGEQRIRIEGRGTPATYDITVSESLADDEQVPFDANGNISGTNAEGTVHESVHGYRFAGEVVDLRIGGEAVVYLNGKRVESNYSLP